MPCVFRGHCEAAFEQGEPASALLLGRQCLACPLLAVDRLRILVAGHALDRLAERRAAKMGRVAVEREVAEALSAGRVCEEELPGWIELPCVPRIRDHAYAWSESRELIFVLEQFGHELVVKTVVLPPDNSRVVRSAAA